MKIYTRVGDKGTTALANGTTVPKTSARIEAYGTIDELNAHIGHLRDIAATFVRQDARDVQNLLECMVKIQNELFALGSHLAKTNKTFATDVFADSATAAKVVKRLEDEIDHFTELVDPLRNFVLPGGHVCNSQAHIVRCVCRRAERNVLRLSESEEVEDSVRIYLNRLSDWFFVAGRVLTKAFGGEEVLWSANR